MGLKSIPGHLLPELAGFVHNAGFKLVQIGGAADPQVDGCDGAILHNFLPSQWREIFALGRALIGVDSWTAHFASILDMAADNTLRVHTSTACQYEGVVFRTG